MVYIYRKYDSNTVDSKHKRLIAGNVLTVGGIMFGAMTACVKMEEGIDMTVSIPCYSLLKLCSYVPGTASTTVSILCLIAPILGALLLTNSILHLKGYESGISGKCLMIAGIVSAIAPLAFFLYFTGLSDGLFVGFLGFFIEENVRIIPGAGLVMQTIGGIISAHSARGIFLEEQN